MTTTGTWYPPPPPEPYHPSAGTGAFLLAPPTTTMPISDLNPNIAADCARAALAPDGPAVQSREPASVVGEPSDAELLELMPETMRDEFSYAAKACSNATGGQVKPGIFRVCLNTAALEFARAVLARWGHQPAPPVDDCGVLPMIISETGADDEPEIERITCAWISGGADYVNNMPRKLGLERTTPRGSIFADYVQVEPDTRVALAQPTPPAEGEVAELVGWLRDDLEFHPAEKRRVADLLTQRHPAPVPVAERLPGPEDCDAGGRCWLLTVEDEYPQWRLHSIEGGQPGGETMIWVPVDSSPGVMVDCFYTSHWLPAHALPLPAEEVGHG